MGNTSLTLHTFINAFFIAKVAKCKNLMPWVGKVYYKGVHLTNIFYIEQHAARLRSWYKPAPAKYLVTQINVSLWSYIVFNNLSKHASLWQHKQTDSGTNLGAASIPWPLGVPGSRMVGNMHNFISFFFRNENSCISTSFLLRIILWNINGYALVR